MILELLGSTAFGSVIGAVSGYLTKKEERASLDMRFKHEVAMVNANTQASIEISKMSVAEAKVAGKLSVQKVEATAFKESQKSISVFADSVKAAIRPIILGVLLYQTWLILSSLKELTSGLESIPEADLIGLYKIVILMITGLTATAVSWYFSARPSKSFDTMIKKWG